MIEIKIPETFTAEDGHCQIHLSEVDKFIFGLKELCNKCNMNNITTRGFANIIVKLNFDDGSSIDPNKLFKACGFDV